MKVAIIPARGGSKRIPRKNVRLFAGKPVIAYAIEAALASSLFDHVLVSTDDADIAHIAKEFGADAPFIRPNQLADDHTVIADVIRHAIEWVEASIGPVDYACCVYATAPMIMQEYLAQGLLALTEGKADFALSVTSFPYPIQRALRRDADGNVSMIQPQYALTRSQDLDDCCHDAAQFFWGTGAAFLGKVTATRTAGIYVPRYTVQDIDTEEDWLLAELLFKASTMQAISNAPRNSKRIVGENVDDQ